MPGRFMPPMALMKEALRRGEMEMDGGLELEGGIKSICKANELPRGIGLSYATVRFIKEEQSTWTVTCGRGRGKAVPLPRAGLLGVACELPALSKASVFLFPSISSWASFLGHRVLCLLKPSVYLKTCFVSRIQF